MHTWDRDVISVNIRSYYAPNPPNSLPDLNEEMIRLIASTLKWPLDVESARQQA
jgi:hypothetical protein